MRSLRADDPERIGQYRLLGRLGEGGMGSVYLAQSPRGRTVAVKLVRPELAGHAEFRHRFEQEVGAARRVGGEWTAPVLDADTEADPPWVATGYIPGITLYEAVADRRTPLPARTLRILANRLARALGAVHEAGLVHRDVKPSNILVTIDGPRVIDFGIARALETVADAHLTRTGAVVGSPGFMSPEQVRGDRVTGSSDIFSLGSVLAFAATGRTPFGGDGAAGHVQLYRITQEEPDLAGVPEELRALVADCLTKSAAQRPGLPEILDRTADPEDEPGPGTSGPETADPWLPAGLVAHLGRHAARLLDAEVPGARAAAARVAEAPAVPPAPGAGPPESPPPPTPAEPAPGTDGTDPAGAEAAATPATGSPATSVTRPRPEGTDPAAARASDAPRTSGDTAAASTPEGGGAQGGPGDTGHQDAVASGTGGAAAEAGAPPPVPGQEQVHGMLTVTGPPAAPAGPRPSYGGEFPEPGRPATPPHTVHGPAADRPERAHGRGMLLGALGVLLALVSGLGTFVALRVYDNGGDRARQQPDAAAEASPGDGSGTPSQEDIGSPAPGGALPKGYLGAWQGSVQEADGSTITRRFEIRQGEQGEVVAKTVNIRADMMCEGEATLVAFEGAGTGLRITSRITGSHPAAKSCSPYREQTLRLRTDGTLSWVYPSGSLSAKLRKVGDPAAPVPRSMAGEWQGTTAQGEERTLTLRRGRVGTATVRLAGEHAGVSCVWESTLGGAEENTLTYGPDRVDGASAPGCAASLESLRITAAGGDAIRVAAVGEPDGAGRVYRRAGSD
ncbi:serine/threonine-protein kinase [Streptomyces qinglanensis]|uniref:serine/threonine-protein kinase n=1 Tax=Streptomyces qinglanensis TaxID=943816 RepID=UPI001EF9393F|nr:serine/threonine-protein kinase [Streptomyces qinglanensis]